jgi:hypothetical protein
MTLWHILLTPAFLVASVLAAEHGTLVREASLFLSPGPNAAKLMSVERGRDMVLLERTNVDNQTWVKVFVTLGEGENQREVTGWINGKGLVAASTSNGDQIIFGEAVDSEDQAEQRGGRKGAAQDAMRLYYRIWDMFPNSPLAGEALWRSADIRWQLEKADLLRAPSSRQSDPAARPHINDEMMKLIEKHFPHSKWSDLAAYAMIDNKLCGEWKGMTVSPDTESGIYEQYAHQRPQSPKAAEALYNAAWRQAALADMYRIGNENDKASNARKKAVGLAQEVVQQYAQQGDWKPRALDLIFKLEQNVPVYGSQE